MKKGLLVFSIITTANAVAFFCYSSSFFGIYLRGIIESKPGDKIGGLLTFLIFNFFTLCATTINLIPNIVHFIKCKKPVVIVLFALSLFLLIASATMLIILIANGAFTH